MEVVGGEGNRVGKKRGEEVALTLRKDNSRKKNSDAALFSPPRRFEGCGRPPPSSSSNEACLFRSPCGFLLAAALRRRESRERKQRFGGDGGE